MAHGSTGSMKGVRLFWYLSRSKLDAFVEEGPQVFQRLSGKLRVSVGAAEAEIGLAPGSSPDPTTLQRLAKLERALPAVELAAAARGAPVAWFRFRGRAARAIQGDGYYLALSDDTAGLLLVGWAGHAPGVHGQPQSVFSPSADPLFGALTWKGEGPGPTESEHSLTYVWASVLAHTARLVDMASLPLVEGVAVYAGQTAVAPSGIEQAVDEAPLRARLGYVQRLVVGSPIYIEQVAG